MAIQELIDEILSALEGKNYVIATEDVLRILSVRREDFYKYRYKYKNRMIDCFDAATTDELIHFLEYLGYKDASEKFARAGLFLDDRARENWLELFHSVSLTRLQNHIIQDDDLILALSGCMNYRDGFAFYASLVADFDSMLTFAIQIYLDKYTIQDTYLIRSLLNELAYLRYKKDGSDHNSIYETLYARLKIRAVELQLISPEATPDIALPDHVKSALREIGISTLTSIPARSEVKKKYRSMMKSHHPDVNKNGQEKSRLLNDAYGQIITFYDQEGIP